MGALGAPLEALGLLENRFNVLTLMATQAAERSGSSPEAFCRDLAGNPSFARGLAVCAWHQLIFGALLS
jgi:hypothetical protein